MYHGTVLHVYRWASIDNCTFQKAIQSVIVMPRRKRVRTAMCDEAKQRLKESDKGSYYNQEAWLNEENPAQCSAGPSTTACLTNSEQLRVCYCP